MSLLVLRDLAVLGLLLLALVIVMLLLIATRARSHPEDPGR